MTVEEDPFASIYEDLNWDAPRGPRRCNECTSGQPVAGAYPSASRWCTGNVAGHCCDASHLLSTTR